MERYSCSISGLCNKEIFDQSLFYRPCEKREPAGSMTSPEAAAQADPGRRNCRTPDSDREDLDGIMIAAVMMDVSDGGVFPTYSAAAASGSAVETVELEDQLYDSGTGMGLIAMQAFRQADKPRKIISFAWTDLQNQGCGKDSCEYVLQEADLISGVEQEYTFYFQPTVYTAAAGHHLEVILMTWDPYRVQPDAWFNPDGSLDTCLEDSAYTMTIRNESLSLCLPTGSGNPDRLTPARIPGSDGYQPTL